MTGARDHGTIAAIVGDPGTPSVLGRYEVMRHLATGGMAEVLLARTQEPPGVFHHVVIKRIRPDQTRDERFVRMFLDEARIAGFLQHPNIVRVFDIGEDRGEYFFAMEYVHGEDLRKVLMEVHQRRDQLPIAFVTGVVAGAAAGLHHAHLQTGVNKEPLGIVHRDVSPANILVGYDGTVKVADFGIAKAALRTVETRSGTLKGKVSYMSPEQVTGKSVDRRSDVFALGIVLYEVTTARRLFKGDNDFLTMSAIVQGNIPKPSLYRPDLPRVLEDIIMTALATSPGDRFQSAEQLRTALEVFTNSLGMRMSAGSIADYMKKLFGMRAEPWLLDDEEPTMTTTIDFDGSASGLVQPPDQAVKEHQLPQTVKPGAHSPIVYARSEASGLPTPPNSVVPDRAATEPPERLAWLSEPTPIRPRSRRRVAGIAALAGVTAAIGMFVILKTTSKPSDKDAPSTVRMNATPPPPEPTPDPVVVTAEPAVPEPVAVESAKVDPPNAEPPAKTVVAPEQPEPAKTVIAPPKQPEPVTVVVTPPKRPEPPARVVVAPKKSAAPKKKPAAVVVKKPPPPAATKKPAASEASGSNWDPNALFAPK